MTKTAAPKKGQTIKQAQDAARKARYRANIAAGRAPTDNGPVAVDTPKPKRHRRTKAQMAAARKREALALLKSEGLDEKTLTTVGAIPASINAASLTDGVLRKLYPQAIPTAQVREVASWLQVTETLISNAQKV